MQISFTRHGFKSSRERQISFKAIKNTIYKGYTYMQRENVYKAEYKGVTVIYTFVENGISIITVQYIQNRKRVEYYMTRTSSSVQVRADKVLCFFFV